jgi:hypothetical protein
MKNDPRYGTEVKIEREKDKSGRTPDSIRKNPHARENVNVAQGPRMGNEAGGSMSAGKRGEFRAAKQARAPLARTIEDAYAKRQHEYEDYEYTNGGSIMDNVNEGKKKTRK